MNSRTMLITVLALLVAVPALAGDKKKHGDRAMIEKMEAVPCGAKERGFTGVGSVFASAGIEHVNSTEKLCPQYLLLTDDMEYHIRPLDHKHPDILPVGKEGEFKVSKDVMDMRVPDGDGKMRRYAVVAMKPIEHHSETPAPESSKYNAPRNEYPDKPADDRNYAEKDKSANKTPDKPNDPPQ
ncbi:MAG: hypothetical protein WB562_20385 [Candidatus Sulfotelmatobacter sp.]